MTDPNKTTIMFIIDRSGSMAPLSSDVEGGFTAMIEEQKAAPGTATVSLVQFDNEYDLLYVDKPLTEVEPYTHIARGGTALFDAIGQGVAEQGARLANMKEGARPSKVIVIIMTDGHENASKEWKQLPLAALIKRQRETYNWEFVFTAANIDAKAYAESLGIAHSSNFAPTSGGIAKNMTGVSEGLLNYRSGRGYSSNN